MEKYVLGSASCYTQKYYFNEEFQDMPIDIQEEIKEICIYQAEKLHGVFTIGFYDSGEVYFSTTSEEGDYHFDEIGSQLEIKHLQIDKKELWKSLSYWYILYKTKEGESIQRLLKTKVKEGQKQRLLKVLEEKVQKRKEEFE